MLVSGAKTGDDHHTSRDMYTHNMHNAHNYIQYFYVKT